MTLTAAWYLDIDPGGLLYWDSSSQTMQVARWEEMSATAKQNIIYAQFGSVVGFTLTGMGDTWTADDIKFDPRTTKTTAWSSIPSYRATETWTDGFVSNTLHTGTNVKAGYGDICMLAGIRATNVTTSNYKNTTWRLPTNLENEQLAGDPQKFDYDDTVTPNMGLFSSGYSLPALGQRYPIDGSPYYWGSDGQYWSSLPTDFSYGHNLDFNKTVGLRPSDNDQPNDAKPARCVRQ